MNRHTLTLAAVPCAIATLAAHGVLVEAMRGWPALVAAAVVFSALLQPAVRKQRA